MEAELEKVRRSFRAELVPYAKKGELVRVKDVARFDIPIEHRRRS